VRQCFALPLLFLVFFSLFVSQNVLGSTLPQTSFLLTTTKQATIAKNP
jgi:hypothetical protein